MMNFDVMNIATLWLFILLSFFSVGFQHTLLNFEDVCVDATTLRPAFVEPFNSHGVIGTFLNAPGMTNADDGGRYGCEPSVRRLHSMYVNKRWGRVVYLSSSAQRPPALRWCWGRKLPDPNRQVEKEFWHDVTDSINQKNGAAAPKKSYRPTKSK